jgi:tRNA(fMet)-specific endonuclease VapC
VTRFMLDTNTVSYLVRGNPAVEARVVSAMHDELCISSITEAELLYGIARRPAAVRTARMIEDFLLRVKSLSWTRREAAEFGRLRAAMEKTGRSLAPVDMLIAAHSMSIGVTLVTSDAAFRHVPGLAVEDWR